ncbi:Hpt domain-containing protein [Mesorhizobium sp. MSK_1335]|uniref:Hpt domain-containing protein n=1 Tax=Mesorhizobium montanum TaxID=3072323 RepID=A0ABU4ZK95_9HYPH|nr:Hpt domain-containing protein [Mesorhizobium sp. MSK_1335]MDX8525782.1 Hpt domain-containing protein [Mesorhizobium sp. MSK_1335]
MAIDRGALAKLRQLVGGAESDLLELVGSFLEEAPSIMQDLRASAQASNLNATRRAAHSLKSNARDMGATELAEVCARLEGSCARGEPPDPREIDSATHAFEAAVAELRGILGG